MKKTFSKLYFYLMLLFLYLPILTLVVFSFNGSKSRGRWGGFSLKWYSEVFNSPSITDALITTVTVALIAAFFSAIIGTISAIGLHKSNSTIKKLLLNITYLPMMNSDIVTGVSLMMVYSLLRLNLGYFTLVLSHITFCIPYVILSVLPKLNSINQSTYEAALDLGATPFMAYRKIILPDILPGIISGFLMSLTLSIDDFLISFFSTGSGVQNISILVYSSRTGVKPEYYALSALMFGSILLLLFFLQVSEGKKTKSNSAYRENRERRNGELS